MQTIFNNRQLGLGTPGNRTLIKPPAPPTPVVAEEAADSVLRDKRSEPLRREGFRILWLSGDYARVCKAGLDQFLRWDGQVWVAS